MKSAEKQTFSSSNTLERDHPLEQLPNHGKGSLRGELLSSFESSGAWVHIPRGTVAVEMNSETLDTEGVFSASDTVTRLREQSPFKPVKEEGAKRFSLGKFMASLDRDVQRKRERGETESNLTFLYDENAEPTGEDELHIPSAVLVHEQMTDEQIEKLRDTLPSGVPILDARTNQLLDTIGAEERQEGRRQHRYDRTLGALAMSVTLGNYDNYDLFSRIDTGYDSVQDFTPEVDDFRREARVFRAETGSVGGDGGSYDTYASYPTTAWADTTTETPRETPPTPESEEVRKHREGVAEQARKRREAAEAAAAYDEAKAENDERNVTRASEVILDKAESLYGTTDVHGLSNEQLKRVEKKVAVEVHPDKGYANGGDTAVAQEASKILNNIQRSHEAKTPPDNTQ